jgi:hypothetical protein
MRRRSNVSLGACQAVGAVVVIFGGFGGMIAGAFCFLIGWWCFGFEGCRFQALRPIIRIFRTYG